MKMKIKITENGKSLGLLGTEEFMAYAKENFGIGRACFLSEYVERFNEKSESAKAQIVLLEESNG